MLTVEDNKDMSMDGQLLLIHTCSFPRGVNWQLPGSYSASIEEGGVAE